MFRREHYVVTSPLLDFLLEVLAEIHGKKLALFIREEVHLTPLCLASARLNGWLV